MVLTHGNDRYAYTYAVSVAPAAPPAPPDPAATLAALSFQTNEGDSFAGQTLATVAFADAAGACASATIEWGDGTTSAGQLVLQPGAGNTYNVLGSHAYAEQGVYQFRVTVTLDAGDAVTGVATALVDDKPLTATAATLETSALGLIAANGYNDYGWWYDGWGSPWTTAGAGEAAAVAGYAVGLNDSVIATFSDANPADTAGDYSALIEWGDGASSAGTVRGAGGSYYVVGSHGYTYAGTYSARVTVLDEGVAVAHAISPVTVKDASAGVPTLLKLPTFQITNPLDFLTTTATWGDGASTSRPVASSSAFWSLGAPGQFWSANFDVSASHLYSTSGSRTIANTVADPSGEPPVSDTRTVQVAESPLKVISTLPFLQGDQEQAIEPATLVVFADAPGNPTKNFQARVEWGDGSFTDVVPMALDDGTYAVQAGHTYPTAGDYAITVLLQGSSSGGVPASAVAALEARVAHRDWSVAGVNVAATAGLSTGNTVVARITDPDRLPGTDPDGQPREFTATIDWGDGQTSDGTVRYAAGSSTVLEVVGAHTYADVGLYDITVTVQSGRITRTGQGQATVYQLTLVQTDGTGVQRTNDPEQAQRLTLGPARVALNTGGLRLSQALDFDQSPGTTVGGDPALVYNSDTVSPRPILEFEITSPAGLPRPSAIRVGLSWDGTPQQSIVSFPTATNQDGDTYLVAVQVDTPVPHTGLYAWQAIVQFVIGGQAFGGTVTGEAAVVANDDPSRPLPLGAGWSIAGIDRLVSSCDTNDLLWVTGSGETRVFSPDGNANEYASAEDFGLLKENADHSFRYTAVDQTKWNFDSLGRLQSVVDTHGLARRYQYQAGRLSEVDTPDGGATTFDYLADQPAVLIHEPGNRTVTLTLDGAGQLQQIQDAAGGLRRFTYAPDGSRLLTRDQWDPLDTSFRYGPAGRLAQVDRGLGTVDTLTPAAVQGLWQMLPPNATGTRLAADAVAVDEDGRLDQNGRGNVTTYTLDTRGRVTQIDRPPGVSESWQRNAHGLVVLYTDGLNRPTLNTYDDGPDRPRSAWGDLLQVDNPDLTTFRRYEYDPTFHKVTLQQDEEGRQTRYAYDPANGDLLTVTDAAGATTDYMWYPAATPGLLHFVTDRRNHPTEYRYDAARRLVETIDANGAPTNYLYDAAGNPLAVRDALGRVTLTLYNGRNELTQQINAAGGGTAWDYSASGLLNQIIDPRSVVTTIAHDSRGWETGRTEAAGKPEARRTLDTYDAAGNLASVSTGWAAGPGAAASYQQLGATTYAYDALNRRTGQTEGISLGAAGQIYLGRTTTYGYDAAGNLLTVTAANGTVTRYDYDLRDRRIREYDQWSLTVAANAAAGTPPTEAYGRRTDWTYDKVGNVLSVLIGTVRTRTVGGDAGVPGARRDASVTAQTSKTVYKYDALGRLTLELEAGSAPREANPAPKPSKPRGQQPGKPSPPRRDSSHLPAVEERIDLPPEQQRCSCWGLPFEAFPGTEDSAVLEVEVKAYRRLIRRRRYRPPLHLRRVPRHRHRTARRQGHPQEHPGR